MLAGLRHLLVHVALGSRARRLHGEVALAAAAVSWRLQAVLLGGRQGASDGLAA